MAQSNEQRRQKRAEYREKQQLKMAREIIAGKRDAMGRKLPTYTRRSS